MTLTCHVYVDAVDTVTETCRVRTELGQKFELKCNEKDLGLVYRVARLVADAHLVIVHVLVADDASDLTGGCLVDIEPAKAN